MEELTQRLFLLEKNFSYDDYLELIKDIEEEINKSTKHEDRLKYSNLILSLRNTYYDACPF